MSAFAADDLKIQVDGHVEQVFGQVVSGNYFETLRRPSGGRATAVARGRAPRPAGGGDRLRVLAASVRRCARYSRQDAVVQEPALRDRGRSAAEFWGLQPGREFDLSLPITLEREQLTDAGSWWFGAVARLRPGVSVAQAAAQADTIYQRFSKDDGRGDAAAAASRLRLRTKYLDHIDLQPASHSSIT